MKLFATSTIPGDLQGAQLHLATQTVRKEVLPHCKWATQIKELRCDSPSGVITASQVHPLETPLDVPSHILSQATLSFQTWLLHSS